VPARGNFTKLHEADVDGIRGVEQGAAAMAFANPSTVL
jgi:hypothetical protein